MVMEPHRETLSSVELLLQKMGAEKITSNSNEFQISPPEAHGQIWTIKESLDSLEAHAQYLESAGIEAGVGGLYTPGVALMGIHIEEEMLQLHSVLLEFRRAPGGCSIHYRSIRSHRRQRDTAFSFEDLRKVASLPEISFAELPGESILNTKAPPLLPPMKRKIKKTQFLRTGSFYQVAGARFELATSGL